MKTQQFITLIGAPVGVLLLSGCCMAMMPAMMGGHGGHAKEASTLPPCTNCGCDKSSAPQAAPTVEPSAITSGHKH